MGGLEAIEKSIDYHKEQLLSLDKEVPNAFLLTTSVILVFVAGQDLDSPYMRAALIAFTAVLFFSLLILWLLKGAHLISYLKLSKGRESILRETRKAKLKKTDLQSFASKLQEIKETVGGTKGVAWRRRVINLLLKGTYMLFGLGMLLLILALI